MRGRTVKNVRAILENSYVGSACRVVVVAALAIVLSLALASRGPAPRVSAPQRVLHHSPAAAYRHYEVGAYYFSGWSHGPNNNITPLLTDHMQAAEPLIGWYDDSQSVVDQSIDMAANSGIDFFAFDWYDIAQ